VTDEAPEREKREITGSPWPEVLIKMPRSWSNPR